MSGYQDPACAPRKGAHVFKPGDMAVITSNEPRCSIDPPDYSIRSLAEGDVVEVVFGPDSDGDYLVSDCQAHHWYVAARFLAPANEPVPVHPSHDWSLREPAPRCTHGADCLAHPGVNRLHNYDDLPAEMATALREFWTVMAKLNARCDRFERRLQGVLDTHRLRDGS